MSKKTSGGHKPPAPHKTNPKAAAAFAQALAWHQQGQLDQARAFYQKALERDPKHTDALVNLGLICLQRGDYEHGIQWIQRSLKLNPRQPDALSNLGVAQAALKHYAEAVETFGRAIALNPKDPVLYNNRGGALKDMYLQQEAIADLNEAIRLAPDYADAYNNRGLAYFNLRDNESARADFERAIEIRPNYALAYRHLGWMYGELKQYAKAIEHFEKALALAPDSVQLLGNIYNCRQQLCSWQDNERLLAQIDSNLEQRKKVISPFICLTLPSTPQKQQICARLAAREIELSVRSQPATPHAGEKIRIGYFSPDFRNHPVTHLVAGLIESHDRNRFEVYGFNIGPPTDDPWRERMKNGFDHFHDVLEKSDDEVVAMAREIGLGIAVDLTGYTQFSRTAIFAKRAAPIQLQYLGYVGTMGAGFIDYTIADDIVVPESDRQYFDEKIIYLPYCYQVNDDKKMVSERQFTRQELGLPENGFVFCCHNNLYKITPDAFDIWMRLLGKTEGSVLWLLRGSEGVEDNLREEARKRGIAPERLVFAGHAPHAEYLARFRAADLFLDTLYYNAGTTASDALWAGLPVLTCRGNTYVGRMAASIVSAAGLPELAAANPQEYEALALRLASDADYLHSIRQRLAVNRPSCPLFDTRQTTRHIEQGLIAAYERQQSGLPPDHIFVQP